MAAANVLTVGTTAASSSDTVIAAATLFGLKTTAADAKVAITLKDDLGGYNVIGALSNSQPTAFLQPGTYKFTRPAGPSCGVYSA
jgi:hypothetical protein